MVRGGRFDDVFFYAGLAARVEFSFFFRGFGEVLVGFGFRFGLDAR